MTTAALPEVAAAERMRRLERSLWETEGFSEAAAELAAGRPATFDGAWGSSCALLAAALTNGGENHPRADCVVAVLPTQREADEFTADLEFFSAERPLLYPAWERDPDEQVIQEESFGERLRTIKELLHSLPLPLGEGRGEGVPSRQKVADPHPNPLPGGEGTRLLVTSIQALLQPSTLRATIEAGTRRLAVGERIEMEPLLRWLTERGFHHTTAVELPGEFCHRGGILDIFAPDWFQPIRIELFDDEIESIRRFDVSSQRSLETLAEANVTVLTAATSDRGHLADFLPPNSWFLLIEPGKIQEEGRNYLQRVEKHEQFHSVAGVLSQCSRFAVATAGSILEGTACHACHLPVESVERFSGDIGKVKDELDRLGEGQEVFVVAQTEAEIERLKEILMTTSLAAAGKLHFPMGTLREGFRFRLPLPLGEGRGEGVTPFGEDAFAQTSQDPHPNPLPRGEGIVIITGGELFHRGELRRLPRRRLGKAIDSFLDLREGDLVVHLAHGIGRYRGLRLIEKQGQAEEHLEIEFDGGTKIYVPAVKIDLVQKYVGGTKTRPSLAKIGGKSWLKQKMAAEEAVRDLAVEMLDMQAIRASRPGITFGPDTDWQREFDRSFPYTETPDQLTAISAIKNDMHRPRPMDRLLCGDVGFGKTEVAMRAAFKAVDNGHQVAVLVPTTILAEQHFHSFRERMAEFPFDISKLSRFCHPHEERETIAGLKSGRIDIVIGTHRLASQDVQFANLGLVVIDEEQRFGVDVKERLKMLRATVDVLTLSATPIPRTLHMSLVGVRDISNLETPPEDRLAVETKVTRWNNDLVRHSILRELSRGGQIYFVHNRVNDIELLANKLRMIVPEARIRVGHAQMADDELEQVMIDFVEHKFDLLLATTIIESGLDIPNANTIFIDEADRYGLADLHQLRGRVGRYKNRAYCYLLIDPHKHITPNAARRLKAIEEFSEMGSGFAISMRDLEIRGAGNLLGTQQSGHIATVGYELYCQLLENAVRTLQKMAPRLSLEVDINLPGDAFLPDNYVDDMRLKIDLYRRLTRVSTFDELADFRSELVDRFGEPPPPTLRLLELAELKMEAVTWLITAIFIEQQYVVFRYSDRRRIEQLARQHKGNLRVVDDKSAYLPIPKGLTKPNEILRLVKSVLRPVK